MRDRRTLWRGLYIVFIVLLGAGSLSVVRSLVAARNARTLAQSLLEYEDILSFDPRREGGQLRPNLDAWMLGERLDLPVRIITNSKGFRNNREFSYDVPDRRHRILLLGDSYVDGMRTDQGRTIGYVLEQLLNEAACNDQTDAFEVMVSGHNNPVDACLDLLRPFQNHYRQKDTHLYRSQGDMHFNENGQELAARELFAFVKQRFESQGLISRACAAG